MLLNELKFFVIFQKGSPLSAKRVKSPFLDDTDVKLNSENSNNLLLERNNSLRSSKRLIRSPMLILKPHKKPKILTPSQEEVSDKLFFYLFKI